MKISVPLILLVVANRMALPCEHSTSSTSTHDIKDHQPNQPTKSKRQANVLEGVTVWIDLATLNGGKSGLDLSLGIPTGNKGLGSGGHSNQPRGNNSPIGIDLGGLKNSLGSTAGNTIGSLESALGVSTENLLLGGSSVGNKIGGNTPRSRPETSKAEIDGRSKNTFDSPLKIGKFIEQLLVSIPGFDELAKPSGAEWFGRPENPGN